MFKKFFKKNPKVTFELDGKVLKFTTSNLEDATLIKLLLYENCREILVNLVLNEVKKSDFLSEKLMKDMAHLKLDPVVKPSEFE